MFILHRPGFNKYEYYRTYPAKLASKRMRKGKITCLQTFKAATDKAKFWSHASTSQFKCTMGSSGSIFSGSSKQHILTGHEGSINDMCISPDGSFLATASEDGTCRVWDIQQKTLKAVMTGHSQYVSCIATSDTHIFTGSADKAVRRWNRHTGECEGVFTGHQSVVTKIIVHGDFLFSASLDKTVRLWSVSTGQCLHVYTEHTRGISTMLLADLSVPDRRLWRKWRSKSALSSPVEEPHKFLLITGSADNSAKAWTPARASSVVTYTGHGSAVICLDVNAGERQLFTGSSDGTARSWDLETGQPLCMYDGHMGPIICLKVQLNVCKYCVCKCFCNGALSGEGRWGGSNEITFN